MNSFIALVLMIFSLSAFSVEECADGRCIPKLLRKTRLVSEIYRAECLPKKIQNSEIENYHKENPLTEQCWRYISEINYLDDELAKQQAILEAQSSCESGDCKTEEVKPFFENIESLLKAVPQNTCTPKKQERVWKRCPDDLKCIVQSFALSFPGYIAEKYLPKDHQVKGCHLGDDSCATKFALAFYDTTAHFLSGLKNVAKLGAQYTADGAKKFWDWMTKSEDHTSTSQLALAKVSENPSLFKELREDFPGTMLKVLGAFGEFVRTWLTDEVFCKKWNGLPHVGKCIRPLDDIKCIGCKSLFTGVFCSLPGTAISELLPAFISGGLTSAIKHGARAGAGLAKTIKTSRVAAEAARNSNATIAAVNAHRMSLAASVKLYRLSEIRKVTQTSLASLTQLSRSGYTYIAQGPAGRAMVFSKKALRSTAQLILLPVENPMTNFAYQAGARSFDKALRLGISSNVGKQPLNVSRGLSILLSPSMHGAQVKEKVKEKEVEKKDLKETLKQ